MRAVIAALKKLFSMTARVSARTSRSLARGNITKYAKNAVRKLNINYKGIRIVYDDLSASDKETVEDFIEFSIRFAEQYANHHDPNVDYRIHHTEIEDVLESHATEILQAAGRAAMAQANAHHYDSIFGKPDNDDAEMLKALALSAIHEFGDELASN